MNYLGCSFNAFPSVDRSHEGQPVPSHDAFPTASPVPTCVTPVSTSQHAVQKGEASVIVAHHILGAYSTGLTVCLCYLVMQQRPPVNQSGLKEEKLPPSPVMRGEQFNPAMRPDHHKHLDNKPSQPGHSQQSEYQEFIEFIFPLRLSAVKYL